MLPQDGVVAGVVRPHLTHTHDSVARGWYHTALYAAVPPISAPTRLVGGACISHCKVQPCSSFLSLSLCLCCARDTCWMLLDLIWLTLFALVLVSQQRHILILPGKRRAEKRAAVTFIMVIFITAASACGSMGMTASFFVFRARGFLLLGIVPTLCPPRFDVGGANCLIIALSQDDHTRHTTPSRSSFQSTFVCGGAKEVGQESGLINSQTGASSPALFE